MASVDRDAADGTHKVEIRNKKLQWLREEISLIGHHGLEHGVKDLVFLGIDWCLCEIFWKDVWHWSYF